MITSILDILNQRAKHQTNQKAYIFLKDGESESNSLTYGELERQAKKIASSLQSWQGERAILLYPSSLEFITAFFGCLYAGVIPVPVCPPRRNDKLNRLLSIAKDAEAKIGLTTVSILSNLKQQWHSVFHQFQLELIATDAIQSNSWDFIYQSDSTNNLAFLQYTSGSTGSPKGVKISHKNIIHNQQIIHQAFGHSKESIGVGWLPFFHDMGLIGHILQPLYVGFPSILMPPGAFIQKPIRWLKTISKYKANTSGGPNFAYDLCYKKVPNEQLSDLDLSNWDLAYCGAERIQGKTLQQFHQKFSQCGFRNTALYSCYGLAEATLFVTGGNKQKLPVVKKVRTKELNQNLVVESESLSESQSFVGCGHSYLNTKVMIVEPNSFTHCDEKKVGEIWISGQSIASGYWNLPKLTKKTFQAKIKGNREEEFLRTGDLGFLLDGELFVTGRIKDVIIIRGENYYPQDIELTTQNSNPALRKGSGAAFSIAIDGREQLVIVQEVERTYIKNLNIPEVFGDITQAVNGQYRLRIHSIALIKTGSISKTSSGKIQRNVCREKFLNGTLNVIANSKRSLVQKLVQI